MNRKILCLLSAAAVLGAGPMQAQEPKPAAPHPAAAPPSPAPVLIPQRYGSWGIDLAGRDTAVKPGDDFNRYANGKFLDNLKIPSDRAAYGVNYFLVELSENQVHSILGDLAKTAGEQPNTDPAKAAALYKAFLDEGRINALGAKPMEGQLGAIRAAKTRADLAALMGGVGNFQASLFDVSIDADPKDPTHYAVGLSQSGLGLPNRDYYLTPTFAEKKAKYQAYVARMLKMAGWADPDAAAKAVVDYETEIAKVSWTRAEQRDPVKTYNPYTIPALQAFAPGFPWTTMLNAAELGGVKRFVVGEKTAFPKIAALYAKTPVPTLKAWAAFHLIDGSAAYLSASFVDARFEFRSKELNGVETQRDRWKRAVAVVDGAMGEAVGHAYVERYFPPEAKAKIDELVNGLRVALKGRLERLAWMSPATKVEALKKLSKLTTKIGYPAKFRDYSALTIKADDLYGDIQRANAWDWRRQVKRLNQPVDRGEWLMTPQTANAYYNPTQNEVVFPAAELQPPFFDPHADAAVNFGGIGSVIGHEITHGFDDEGRQFDGDGRLRDWWTAEDAKKFEATAKVLGAQFSSYEVAGAHVNGDLTMGENIADLGGLLVALDAYHQSLGGKPAPVIDGLTGDQRFFLAFAQGWRDKRRADALRQQMVSDPHSPEEFRVNGPVRNIEPWYSAFDVKPGEKLYLKPEDRAHVW